MLFSERADFALANQLRAGAAPLGDVYTFVSGLYFRGKMAYSRAFAAPPGELPPAVVITPGRGLVSPELPVTIDELRQMAEIPIDAGDPRYIRPLEEHAQLLHDTAPPDCSFILLGSIATGKYTDPLIRILGERLLFPAEFVGRGDMSRGGLMLRCAQDGVELNYIPAKGAVRRGIRPPKLPKPGARRQP